MKNIIDENVRQLMEENEYFKVIISHYKHKIYELDDLLYLLIADSCYCISAYKFNGENPECECEINEEEVASCYVCWANHLRKKHRGINYGE